MSNINDSIPRVFIMDFETCKIITTRTIYTAEHFRFAVRELAEIVDTVNKVEPEDVWGCFLFLDEEIYSLQLDMNNPEAVEEWIETIGLYTDAEIMRDLQLAEKEIAEGKTVVWSPGMFLKEGDSI